MATKTLKISKFDSALTGVTKAELNTVLEKFSWDGHSLKDLQNADITAVTVADGKITIQGVGVLDIELGSSSANKVIFTADAALIGDVTFQGNIDAIATLANAIFTKVNTAKAAGLTATVKDGGATFIGTSGDDKITTDSNQIILAGAGNDTLVATTVTKDFATLSGGAGADLFDLSGVTIAPNAGDAPTTITDYSYAEGDIIRVPYYSLGNDTVNGTPLAGNGVANLYYASSIVGAVTVAVGADNVYKMQETDGKTTQEYWTVSDKSAAATKADASGVKNNVVMKGHTDGDSLIGGSGNDTLIAGSQAGAVIWGGAGNDYIELSKTITAKDTLWFGTNDGKDTVSGFDDANDIINLYDSTISDLKLVPASSGSNVDPILKLGNANLLLKDARYTNVSNTLRFQESGGAVKKVVFDFTGAQTLNAVDSSDPTKEANDIYRGLRSTVDYSKFTGASLKVDLYTETAKYQNIAGINAANIANSVYIGAKDKATTITAAAGSATGIEIWGGGAHADSINLAGATGDQTIWFGKADGNDTVTAFSAGFAATDDVVYLYDTADVSTVGFTKDTAGIGTDIKVGNATLNLAGVTTNGAGGALLQVKDSAGKINKFAVGTMDKNQTITAASAAGVADYVVATGPNATVAYTGAVTTAIKADLQDTKAYKNVANIDASLASGDVTAIGTGNGSDIKLGAGTNAVWGGGAGNDTITLNVGKTEIWYSGSYDGKDSVANFASANDSVYFWDMSTKDVVKNATFTSTDGKDLNLKFSDKNILSVASTASISGAASAATGINIKDNTGATTKLLFSQNTTEQLTYTTDVKVYVATGDGNSSLKITGADDVFLYLDNVNVGAPVNDIYFKGITELDASAGFGNSQLVGAAGIANTLTGGKGTTAMWGGGLASDSLVGGAGVDAAWFGNGDGVDTFSDVQGQDKVVLWSATAIDDIKATYTDGGDLTISTTTGDVLLIKAKDKANLSELTFQVGTADATAAKYTFNTETKAFQAK